MAKQKLKRFNEFSSFENSFEFDREKKGKWRQEIFKNNNPLILELACGRGEYTLALAQLHPENNYIGIDIKGNRLWRGAKTAIEENIPNAAFLRIRIEQIEEFFDPAEVDEIWITFPDPFTPNGEWKKRLTSSVFLDKYRKIIKPGGIIHLKTDDLPLHEFSVLTAKNQGLEILEMETDLYNSPLADSEILQVKTTYENKFLRKGKKITYLKFRLT